MPTAPGPRQGEHRPPPAVWLSVTARRAGPVRNFETAHPAGFSKHLLPPHTSMTERDDEGLHGEPAISATEDASARSPSTSARPTESLRGVAISPRLSVVGVRLRVEARTEKRPWAAARQRPTSSCFGGVAHPISSSGRPPIRRRLPRRRRLRRLRPLRHRPPPRRPPPLQPGPRHPGPRRPLRQRPRRRLRRQHGRP